MISTDEGRSWETDYDYDYGIDMAMDQYLLIPFLVG